MNIEIKVPSGEIVSVELISYFEIVNSSKKYLFYTKNETVENNLIKMYVAEVIAEGSVLNIAEKMTDEEWTNLKTIMKSILTGGNNVNIRYLEVGGV